MKATGIIRRVDEMGRIVIPKDIRQAYRLKDGDPMEFFIEDDNVIMQKYNSPIKGDMPIEEKTYGAPNKRKAIFAGSFDPFTNGHLALATQASKLFDKLVVAIGINSSKNRHIPVDAMMDAIKTALISNHLDNCEVVYVDGPIAKYCAEHEIEYSIRGLRNNMDFNYESEITKINKLINPDLQTIYLPSDNDAISSSMVREFLKYDIPICDYVPDSVLKILLKMGM